MVSLKRRLISASILFSSIVILSPHMMAQAQDKPPETTEPRKQNHPLISGEDLRDLISDNTVTGRHDTGMAYSEWHAPDGRVYGHNNHVMNE
jgi:hypothetical protein